MEWLKPITLQSDYVKLVPLSNEHHDELAEAVRDGELWNLSYAAVPHPQKMKEEIRKRLSLLNQEKMLPFTVIHHPTNKIVGMTTYCQVDSAIRRLDIGFTWYAKSYWRTALNTECKALLLTHAFEQLDCIAVGFRVDTLNQRSQNAERRLGATFEGVVRNYGILPNGNTRDMCFFSILPHEWPRIKSHLGFLKKEARRSVEIEASSRKP